MLGRGQQVSKELVPRPRIHSMPPRIAVTGPENGGIAMWIFLWFAVVLAGGRPTRMTPRHRFSLDEYDGLIISGGVDVDMNPDDAAESLGRLTMEEAGQETRILRALAHYIVYPLVALVRWLFRTKHPNRLDHERDAMEMAALNEAEQLGIPILGICRGAQLMNIVRGGSLHRDLTAFYTETTQIRTIFPRKRVEFVEKSLLRRVFNAPSAKVNALHNQAVDTLGAGLDVTAVEDTGVVQAIEDQSLPFFIGVQWHPEFLPQKASHRALFRTLVEISAQYRRSCPDLFSV
ncbi:gamma-glutamyl-gamma-aminobutyrate hydrolase family protein [Desulfovibrio inopinatus]|uniref:gamma-glutamyl-gamma-aminobutyrate hydrolase family protein n=1 Tax=Desulfovibrio inopinatus TaxID=102109 RepID=UPI0003FEE83B|nr:gamma-glutamyl-gamma-aminobutyrate hydrolase family protein [Desulfovibrio inopinatus]